MDNLKTRARRHRAHDDHLREALSDRPLGPDAEERQAKRNAKSRKLRKERKKRSH